MTLTDLYRKALERLQIVADGESAAASDTALVASKYASLYQMLRAKQLVAWAATDDVPAEAVIPLTAMLAWAAADEFGQDANAFAAEGSIDLPQVSLAERQLRGQLARQYVSQPAASEYF